jgi:hypothetical protein
MKIMGKFFGIVMVSLFCIGCKTTQPTQELNIYQPSVLRPILGTIINTKDGIYKVQTNDEVWHSDKRYRELENSILR